MDLRNRLHTPFDPPKSSLLTSPHLGQLNFYLLPSIGFSVDAQWAAESSPGAVKPPPDWASPRSWHYVSNKPFSKRPLSAGPWCKKPRIILWKHSVIFYPYLLGRAVDWEDAQSEIKKRISLCKVKITWSLVFNSGLSGLACWMDPVVRTPFAFCIVHMQ